MRRQVAVVLTLAGLWGCGSGASAPSPVQSPRPAASPTLAVPPQAARFVEDLRGAGGTVGAVVIRKPRTSFPWIDVPAVLIPLEDGHVWAFEYATTAEAEAVERNTSADGHQFASAQVSWISDPHMFRSDRVIVLYVGRSRPVLDLLERILGPQFAGR